MTRRRRKEGKKRVCVLNKMWKRKKSFHDLMSFSCRPWLSWAIRPATCNLASLCRGVWTLRRGLLDAQSFPVPASAPLVLVGGRSPRSVSKLIEARRWRCWFVIWGWKFDSRACIEFLTRRCSAKKVFFSYFYLKTCIFRRWRRPFEVIEREAYLRTSLRYI